MDARRLSPAPGVIENIGVSPSLYPTLNIPQENTIAPEER